MSDEEDLGSLVSSALVLELLTDRLEGLVSILDNDGPPSPINPKVMLSNPYLPTPVYPKLSSSPSLYTWLEVFAKLGVQLVELL